MRTDVVGPTQIIKMKKIYHKKYLGYLPIFSLYKIGLIAEIFSRYLKSPKIATKSQTEDLIFRWILLKGVIWHPFLEIWVKLKNFLWDQSTSTTVVNQGNYRIAYIDTSMYTHVFLSDRRRFALRAGGNIFGPDDNITFNSLITHFSSNTIYRTLPTMTRSLLETALEY